jgi:chloramphenicol-sensitive protein RarD
MRRDAITGGLYAVAAFGAWGLVPLYWKTVRAVPGVEMVAHRVLWSVPVVLWLVARRRRLPDTWATLADRRHRRLLTWTAALVALNWLVFIWAVQRDVLLEASLGYYVTPLFNVLLGAVVLHERLRPRQWVAVALAATGVTWLAVAQGTMPWTALALAATFSTYGLLRKRAGVDALAGLSAETLILAPLALAWFAWLLVRGEAVLPRLPPREMGLVAASGVVTAIPLLWFAHAARRLRLATIGFFQYLAPTGQLLLAVLVYGEPFGRARAVAFGFIWAAVALYLWDAAAALRGEAGQDGSSRR